MKATEIKVKEMTITKKEASIPEWFKGKDVMITGATGFMGKVLLAKLLMSCPEIGTIYVVIRDKKGVLASKRLTHLIQQEPFRILREKHPQALKKISVISGNTTYKCLGLDESTVKLLEKNICVLINMAANVRFDQPLKNAVNMNTLSTANIIAFAKKLKNLESFVHVSTAYCHCGEPVLEEKHYPVEISPEDMIRLVNETPEDILEEMTSKLLGAQPNTYALTKGLSEDLVYKSKLPAGIARPSIVTGSWKEPDSGWVDNMNGPTGLMVGAGKGVIRTMLCNSDHFVDLMPCDMAVNATIALAWRVGIEKPEKPIFLNITESRENKITWRYALESGKKHALANPFSGPLWYPGGGYTSSKILHVLSVFFLHIVPAYFIDGLIILSGNKPFLVKVQAKVNYGINLVYYYTTKQWFFKNDRLRALREMLSPEDKKIFFMDIREIKWDDYMLSYILSTRKYCLKDDPSTLPRARRVFAYLYALDIAVKIGFCMLCLWLIYSGILSAFYKITFD